VNFVLAAFFLPESLSSEARGQSVRGRRMLDVDALRSASRIPGVKLAIVIGFLVTFWFAGLEQTFRLFTADEFGMSVAGTGRLFGFVGVVAVVVQGGLIHRLNRRYGEVRLVRAGTLVLALAFAGMAISPSLGGAALLVLFISSGGVAFGNGLYTPTLSSFVSRQAGLDMQGATLGVLQSMGALARAVGPLAGGVAYEVLSARAPYYLGAIGIFAATIVSLGLAPLAATVQPAKSSA
jgi:predicted MFS family arabinose efflux permease